MFPQLNTSNPSSSFTSYRTAGTYMWTRPPNASMYYILALGAGGGGRAGTTSAGGAGGGAGCLSSMLGSADTLPDRLILTVGTGGAGGNPGAGTGGDTLIKCLNGDVFVQSIGGSGQNAGSAGTNQSFLGLRGAFQTGSGAGPAANYTSSGFPVTGGGGGATSATGTGGSVATLMGYTGIPAAAVNASGANGFTITSPVFLSWGGGGGGGSSTTGGNGGNGGNGAGGGGGGRGTVTPGNGGNGGDGLIFIWTW